MKMLLSLLLPLIIFPSGAQPFSPAEKGIIDAENAFALMSKETNTRDAFIANFDEEGIVFDKSNPVSGKKLWESRKPNNSLLFWWPVFTDVSSSGDFGYNTGPFEWSADRSGLQPGGFGYFSSVWKKNNEGVWKVAIDIGMSLPSREERSLTPATSKKKPIVSGKKIDFLREKSKAMVMDKDYVKKLNAKSVSLIFRYLSNEIRVHRTGHFPLHSLDEIHSFPDSREKYYFEHLGGDIASSGDLAYAYGKVNSINKKDQQPVTLNYLRIWKREDGRNWKIVLDVIGG
jgi:ketosteroid isomerase-like protein